MLFADAAPTGAGLGIVAAILLAFLAFWIVVAYFVVRTIVRFFRKRAAARDALQGGVDPAAGTVA